MRAFGLFVLCALVAPVAIPAVPASVTTRMEMDTEPPLAHPSITIEGDAAFRSISSGLRRGSGTAENPFIIANWTIQHTEAWGVRLQGTRAHVVLQNLLIPGIGLPGAAITCLTRGCDFTTGVHLVDSENVTIRSVRILNVPTGIEVDGGARVLLRDSVIGRPCPETPEGPICSGLQSWGLFVEGARDLALVNVTFSDVGQPLALLDTQGVVLTESSVLTPSVLGFTRIRDTLLIGNEFQGVSTLTSGNIEGLHVVGNHYRGGLAVLTPVGSGNPELRNGVFCGNRIEDMESPDGAVDLNRAIGVRILNNSFIGNAMGVDINEGSSVVIDGNAFWNSSYAGVSVGGTQVHGNSFQGNLVGAFLGSGADGTLNWWGHPSGPSGSGPGQGDPAYSALPLEPWLTAPPELNFQCEAPPNGAAVERLVVSATADAFFGIEFDETTGPFHAELTAQQEAHLDAGEVPLGPP